MASQEEKTKSLEDLLVRASQAHHKYETEELKGVYDQAWPQWYARWAVENGLNGLVARPQSAEAWGRILAQTAEEHKQKDPEKPWAAYYAGVMARDFG